MHERRAGVEAVEVGGARPRRELRRRAAVGGLQALQPHALGGDGLGRRLALALVAVGDDGVEDEGDGRHGDDRERDRSPR